MLGELLRLFWPFLCELILGKNTSIDEAIRKRGWRRVIGLYIVAVAVVLSALLVPRTISLSIRLVGLQRELEVAKADRVRACAPTIGEVVRLPKAAATRPTPEPEPVPLLSDHQPQVIERRSPHSKTRPTQQTGATDQPPSGGGLHESVVDRMRNLARDDHS